MSFRKLITAATVFASLSAPALAQTNDPTPVPPTPPIPVPEDEVKEYSGVGSNIAYSSAGVIELGGSFAFSANSDVVNFSADPSIGYFLWDNIQGSVILGSRMTTVDGESASRFSVVLEPSFHYPFSRYVFGFVGLGAGVATATPAIDGVQVGAALAPRAGVQFLVGRSGLVNVGARQVVTFVDVDTDAGVYDSAALLAFANSFDAQIGYTVMF